MRLTQSQKRQLDLLLLHAPRVYDFREHAIVYGPVSDMIPSSTVFEMYPSGFLTIASYLHDRGMKVRIVNLALRVMNSRRFARGEVEDRIKKLHRGLEIDRTSCTRLLANQLRVLLTAAAYVLMQKLRLTARRGDCACAQVRTLRERLLKFSVWVERSVRRIVLHLLVRFAYGSDWLRIARYIGVVPALPIPANLCCTFIATPVRDQHTHRSRLSHSKPPPPPKPLRSRDRMGRHRRVSAFSKWLSSSNRQRC